MNWSLEQTHRIENLMQWYGNKVNKVLEGIEREKIKIETYWNDIHYLTKSVRSDNQLREWQIVLENMENIMLNRYVE